MGKIDSSILMLLFIVLTACDREATFGPIDTTEHPTSELGDAANRILIGCEGNFQLSNASLTIYDKVSGEVSSDAFQKANDRNLGDVFQSMIQIGDTLIMSLNNSGEVIFCDAISLQVLTSVSGLTSPRYLLNMESKLWVSDLHSGYITVLNKNDGSVSSHIDIGRWTEQMTHVYDRVWTGVLEGDPRLIAVDDESLMLVDSFDLKVRPRMVNAFDSLLVTAGELGDGTGWGVQGFDLKRMQEAFFLSGGEAYASGTLNSEAGWLYLLSSERVQAIDLLTITARSFPHDAQSPYGIGLDSKSSVLYVCDAKDFVSDGEISRFHTDGNSLGKFSAEGAIPQSIIALF